MVVLVEPRHGDLHTSAKGEMELPGQWKLSVGGQLRLLPAMIRIFGRRLPRLLKAIIKLEARHPSEPHYYLPFVGVEPRWQGRGLGSALLAPILERCDRESLPAFLEASTARNRALYERHGFAVTEEFRLGRSAPRQWRMWREPREAGAGGGAVTAAGRDQGRARPRAGGG